MSIIRIPFRIVVDTDPWGRRTLVMIEPRQVDRPTQSFRDENVALAYAEQLKRVHGWPILDKRDVPPEAA
jgi:hypothetical protein